VVVVVIVVKHQVVSYAIKSSQNSVTNTTITTKCTVQQ